MSECCDGCFAINESGSCSDGTFCNGTETCVGGACVSSSDNPCVGPDIDTDCHESCDEDAGTCLAYDGEGTLCELDGVGCNVDTCTGGACVYSGISCPIFVDDSAMGANNGTSWTDAFLVIQDGADKAESDSNLRVFVAQGIYGPPDAGPDANLPVLTMKPRVGIYGGFAGTEDLLEERPGLDAGLVSILDGELNGSVVVVGASDGGLDRFTVTNGYNSTTQYGGGMYNADAGNLTISDVTRFGRGFHNRLHQRERSGKPGFNNQRSVI
ncbi:MAG: hypothetical protein GY854_34475 [Deltaproteobacteria bacterium]|nr:hypothetical protein [Deltaproteobacteria bacterium]